MSEQMVSPPIRTAILGYGRSGSTLHANPLAARPEFTVVAVCDIDPERREQARTRFNCRVYEHYPRMLAEEQLDLVVVVTPSNEHCRMALDCLAAGVHVLVTKPWAVNADEARQMVAAGRSAKGLLMPWLPARWGSDLLRLKQLIAERDIGDVFLVRRAVCTFQVRNDWQMLKRFGGGYLLNWGPHIVEPPIILVNGRVKTVFGQLRQTINPGDAEDVFLGVLTMEDGTIVQCEYTIAAEQLPSWFIQGTQGTIVVRDRALLRHRKAPVVPDDPTIVPDPSRAYGQPVAGDEVIEEQLTGNLYGDEHEIYRIIARAIAGTDPYPVLPEQALELSRIFDAMKISSSEQRLVFMDELRG